MQALPAPERQPSLLQSRTSLAPRCHFVPWLAARHAHADMHQLAGGWFELYSVTLTTPKIYPKYTKQLLKHIVFTRRKLFDVYQKELIEPN